MKIAVICKGTRGDVQPVLALALAWQWAYHVIINLATTTRLQCRRIQIRMLHEPSCLDQLLVIPVFLYYYVYNIQLTACWRRDHSGLLSIGAARFAGESVKRSGMVNSSSTSWTYHYRELCSCEWIFSQSTGNINHIGCIFSEWNGCSYKCTPSYGHYH